jgi:hypothetical protein
MQESLLAILTFRRSFQLSMPGGHPAQEKPDCQCSEKHRPWLLCRGLCDLSSRLTDLIGSLSISALGFSGSLPRLTGSLRLSVSGNTSDGLLDFAQRILRSALNTILIDHCVNLTVYL